MKKIALFILMTKLSCDIVSAQSNLNYFLPQDITYDENIPTPASVLGHEVGEWHVSHDKLVQYMYALAKSSDRISIQEYARTYENRPLLLLTISSPDNHSNIETIQKRHVEISDPNISKSIDLSNEPVVDYLGYSVHGNEASGSNAALLVAYYLAAAQGEYIEKVLKNTIILLDPCYNPDGLNRFASWVNSRKSLNLVTDPNNDEQNEPWPRGRTNHYWFDLNRDWMPLQHPESRGRVALFHQWKPNIFTDHHEMGTNSTYFFQPGVPSRDNPFIPSKTQQLNAEIATYHAAALDQIGSFYYSAESFDDFYIGKGSTYPDINGGVGILFEQASARGHAQESINGVVTFPFAIRNHFTTSLSTIKASLEMKDKLLENQRQFYHSSLSKAKNDLTKAYIFSETEDRTKMTQFMSILNQHQIKVYKLAQTIHSFKADESYIVPLDQPQYLLIKNLFTTSTTFQDSLFYDVSAWTLPLAFDIPFTKVDGKKYTSSLLGKATKEIVSVQRAALTEASYAYVFDWEDYNTPALLYAIQQTELRTKVSTESIQMNNGVSLGSGSIIIPIQNQNLASKDIWALMQKLSVKYDIAIHALNSGKMSNLNLGSPRVKNLTIPKPLLVVGTGVNGYEAGEVWHLLDQRMNMPLPKVTINQINRIDLAKYNTIIMVGGSYGKINQVKLKSWLQNGGRIIAIKSAAKWLNTIGLSTTKFVKITKDTTQTVQLPYATANRKRGAQEIGGTIFAAQMDLTHPICYGYADDKVWTLKNSKTMIIKSSNPFANPVIYTDSPLAAGYVSKENLKRIENTAVVGLSMMGRGKIISFADNPNFRAFWYGTNKLFLNALFFGEIIQTNTIR